MNPSTSWAISDSTILIPVVSNCDSSESNVIVGKIRSGEASSTSLGHTLLIGLNKKFFGETTSSKEVIFVQHPDADSSDLQVNIPVECELTEEKPNENYIISFVEPSKESTWSDSQLGSILAKDELIQSVQEDFKTVLYEGEIEKSLLTTFVQKQSSEYSGQLVEKSDQVEKSLLPEQNLPLKKKAKMKDTSSRLVEEMAGPSDSGEAESIQRKNFRKIISLEEMKLMREEMKKQGSVPGKRKCCFSDSELSDSEDNVEYSWPIQLDLNEIGTMTDLVDKLKEHEFIDDDFSQLVLRGVAEMKVDILEELKTGSHSGTSKFGFSYELLAFAFLLYYHRRKVYHYMSHVWKSTWPPKEKLMEWKKLVNSVPKKKRTNRILKK